MSASDISHDGEPVAQDAGGFSRREAMRRAAVAAGGLVAVGAGGSKVAPRYSPVGRAQALPPVVAAYGGYVAVAGGAAAVGWALREWDVIGSDDPPEGLTPEALQQTVYETARTRESTNASTFVDNQNILDGAKNAWYADGKIAGIESINAQDSESDVQTAAVDAGASSASTVMTNLLKSWNESVLEFEKLYQTVNDHADLNVGDVFAGLGSVYSGAKADPSHLYTEETYELPNGEDFDVYRIGLFEDGTTPEDDYYSAMWSPIEEDVKDVGAAEYGDTYITVTNDGGDETEYLDHEGWNAVFEDLETAADDVNNGLVTWVGGVYGEVQSGELDTEDLLTPSELAEMTADEEDFNQAVADLMALNIPIDLEREAEVYLSGIDATIYGQLAVTSEPSGGVNAGDTIDPETTDEDYYLTYDVSQGHGTWSAVETGVDGGTVTFTNEPFGETLFAIQTVAGETVEVTAEDFTEDDSGSSTVWTADLSDQLETQITEVDTVEMRATTEETQFETIQLQQSFEIVTFTDSEGNEHDSADFSQSEPQDDSNYITEEEWAAMEERQQQLIEKYEDAQNDDNGLQIPGVGAVTDIFDGIGKFVVIGGAGLLGIKYLSDGGN